MSEQLDQVAAAAVEAVGDTRNLEETARFFGRSVPTVRSWVADGCPVTERGTNGVGYKLSLRAVSAWLADREAAVERDAEAKRAADQQLKLELLGDTLPDLAAGGGGLSAKARADVLRAELDRAKLGQLRRELVRADDVRLTLSRVFAGFSASARALPDQLAGRFGWDEGERQAVADAVEAWLNDTADQVAELADGGVNAGND